MKKETENVKNKPRYSMCTDCGELAVNDTTLLMKNEGKCPYSKSGKHEPWKGNPPYTCVYCQKKIDTQGAVASSLLTKSCPKHPNGSNKGNHALSREGFK